MFRRIIEDKVDILPAVDSLVYEQSMGLTGWVAGRRVLVGNRRLLENHGVDVPSRDYELRYTQNGRQQHKTLACRDYRICMDLGAESVVGTSGR